LQENNFLYSEDASHILHLLNPPLFHTAVAVSFLVDAASLRRQTVSRRAEVEMAFRLISAY
jgi:hypothetical protein